MFKKFVLLSFIIIGHFYFSQIKFSGQILSENGHPIVNVNVVNISNSQSVLTDINGNFSIVASPKDEVRFAKKGFERNSHTLSSLDFVSVYKSVLKPHVIEIEEIDLGKVLTGVLKNDLKKFTDKKTEMLNTNLAIYMKSPMQGVIPKATVPKAFQLPKVNMLALDLISTTKYITKLIKGESNIKPAFGATDLQFNQFYINLKNDLGNDYFKSLNIKEQDVDAFLRFAENKLKLCSRYFKNYNVSLIMVELEQIHSEFNNSNKA